MLPAIALLQLMVSVLPGARAQFPFPGAPMAMGAPGIPPPGMPPPAHGPLPMPLPMHMPMAIRQQHVPVVVMPYRSKSSDRVFKKKKRRKPIYYSSSSTSSDASDRDCSSSPEYEFRGRKRRPRRKKKREVLTPVISYLTRKGRIVYQKKIKKENPSDWLSMGKQRISLESNSRQGRADNSAEMTVRDLKKKYKLKKRKHKH